MKRVIISGTLIFLFIAAGTFFAILYAKGYRFTNSRLEGTGVLVLSSRPDGARVSINGHLTTATNNTINLAPGEYDVKIEKDGYFPWHKKIVMKNELVREATAVLYPIAPRLEAVTFTGASHPVLDPSGTLIAFTLTSGVKGKSGIYLLDMNARPILSIGGVTNQVTDTTADELLTEADLTFSPDGRELLASVSGSLGTTYYLLNPKTFTQVPQDVTATLPAIENDWQKVTESKNKQILNAFPKKVREAALEYFKDLVVSQSGEKILYTASKSATLPVLTSPHWASVNSTPEQRNLKEGAVYVYNIKDDRNYFIYEDKTTPKTDESTDIAALEMPKFRWLPDSTHLAYIQGTTINVVEYDGQNKVVVYAGPFVDHYLFPWPDGSALVIVTNLNIPDAPNNLYRISLK